MLVKKCTVVPDAPPSPPSVSTDLKEASKQLRKPSSFFKSIVDILKNKYFVLFMMVYGKQELGEPVLVWIYYVKPEKWQSVIFACYKQSLTLKIIYHMLSRMEIALK